MFSQEIELKHRAGYSLLYVVAKEEQRAWREVQAVATRLSNSFSLWTLTTSGGDPTAALKKAGSSQDGFEVFINFHRFLDDAETIQVLKDKRETLKEKGITIIFISNILKLPPELENDFTVIEFGLPDEDMLSKRIDFLIDDKSNALTAPAPALREQLVDAMLGLTTWEAENALALSLVETKGSFDPVIVRREKAQIIKKSGILEIYQSTAQMSDVGGLDVLKSWLRERADAFSDAAREFGLPIPKGVLFIGVPGCGKSLTAKAIAAEWKLPLIRLDLGRLFAGIVGASEANVRTAIQTAEAVAPCILWIDEVEKGLAGLNSSGSTDSGVSSRVFGSIITWMQEKTRPVFLVMTANRVQSLPPEFLRAGRLDEIFFLDLPSLEERKDILQIHLQKRKRSLAISERLLHKTNEYSGAELENVIIKALYKAFQRAQAHVEPLDITADDLYDAASSMVPLAQTRREEINEIREWARSGRALFASSQEAQFEFKRRMNL